MEEPQQVSRLSSINQSFSLLNMTDLPSTPWSFVFPPAGFTTKLITILLLTSIGIVGFLGNSLIYYFVSKKNHSLSYLQFNPFERNLRIYIKSLALSDLFSCAISIPLACIQVTFYPPQHAWSCKVLRFLNVLFPSITLKNITVISIERYLSTRAIPRSLSISTVRKLVSAAWILGFITALIPATIMTNVKYDLSDKQYTTICTTDISSLPFKIIAGSSLTMLHLLPSLIIVYLNTSVAKTLWVRHRKKVDILKENAIRASARAATVRGTCLLISFSCAFVIPFSISCYYGVYVKMTRPSLDFQTDYVTKSIGSVLMFSNCVINFILYMLQMKDFRTFVRKLIYCHGNNARSQNSASESFELNRRHSQ